MEKIRCNSNPADFLKVSVFAGCAYVDAQQGDESTEIELSPDKIRKLRKQLMRALIEIEGVSGEEKDCDYAACEVTAAEWKPKPGDKVKFVDSGTLDEFDKIGWHPEVGEIYVVRHVYDTILYDGFSLYETPDSKITRLRHGYKFRQSGFEPA